MTGSVLLHIGPHKTGTTSVQSAFHLARRAAAETGVHYAGPDRHAVVAVQAGIDPATARRSAIGRWHGLVGEIRRAAANGRRVVLSSEWLADAQPPAIRRIVDELREGAGGAPVHVAVTVRPLERLLPSQWQQYVAAGFDGEYEAWLHAVLEGPDRAVTPTFWHRHRHDALVRRWADAVGAGNVTVIVVDDLDHGAVLRVFEGLVDLRPGTLVAEEDRGNRSLTVPEAELMRALNRRLAEDVPAQGMRLNLGLYGAAAALRGRRPADGEPRLAKPAWAAGRVDAIQREIVEGLRRSGAEVVGDLDRLAGSAADAGPTAPPSPVPVDTWLDVAATAAVGVLTTAGLARARRSGAAHRAARDVLRPLSTARLARVVAGRARSLPGAVARAVARDGAAPAVPREPTADEDRLLRSFEAAIRAEGLPSSLARRVVRDGVLPEMLARLPTEPSSGPASWPELGASLSMGVVRAAGLLPGRPGRRRIPPPLSTVETSDVARISTPAIALEVGRRLAARPLRAVARGRDS